MLYDMSQRVPPYYIAENVLLVHFSRTFATGPVLVSYNDEEAPSGAQVIPFPCGQQEGQEQRPLDPDAP